MSEPGNQQTSPARVALVHDWLIDGGGAERHFAAIARLWPEAPIYTSAYRPQTSLAYFRRREIRVGWPGRLWFFGRRHRLSALWRWLYWLRLDLSAYDLIISSSGSEAKAVRSRQDQIHINVCYSPTHYYWSHYRQYRDQPGLGRFDWLGRLLLPILVGPLRRLDYWAAQRPDLMVANSTITATRIRRYYGRSSSVVFPPVVGPAKQLSGQRRGYVIISRLVPYKNIDLAVRACRLTQRQLTVIGDGPDRDRLQGLAGPTINFVGNVTEATKWCYLAGARGFIFAGIDDFGMVMVEALAAGTPVIALAAGGALDIVGADQTGIFFKEATTDSLAAALDRFEGRRFHAERCRRRADMFSVAAFQKRFTEIVAKAEADFSNDKQTPQT